MSDKTTKRDLCYQCFICTMLSPNTNKGLSKKCYCWKGVVVGREQCLSRPVVLYVTVVVHIDECNTN